MAITKDKRNRDGEKSLGQTHLFNIGIIEVKDRTVGQAQVMLRLMRSAATIGGVWEREWGEDEERGEGGSQSAYFN